MFKITTLTDFRLDFNALRLKKDPLIFQDFDKKLLLFSSSSSSRKLKLLKKQILNDANFFISLNHFSLNVNCVLFYLHHLFHLYNLKKKKIKTTN